MAFSIYKLGETWVKQNLDSIVKEYVKRWLHLPQIAITSHKNFINLQNTDSWRKT